MCILLTKIYSIAKKCEEPVGKMAWIDLLDAGLPQTFNFEEYSVCEVQSSEVCLMWQRMAGPATHVFSICRNHPHNSGSHQTLQATLLITRDIRGRNKPPGAGKPFAHSGLVSG